MYNRHYAYLTDNNILSNKQFGFRAGHSTEHACSELIDKVSDFLEDKLYSLSIFIDLLKAFDTAGHESL